MGVELLSRSVSRSPIRVPSRAPNEGVGVLLFDDFERDDTSDGDLGSAPVGGEWDLRAPYVSSYPLPVSDYGKIASGAFVVPGGQVVYAGQTLPRQPREVTVKHSWLDDTTGTQFTTLAIIVSNSANWVDNMLHITLTNSACNIQKRISGGSFTTMNTGQTTISPSLALLDTEHTVKITIAGTSVRVQVDNDRFDVTVTDADIPSVAGKYVVVEHYSGTTDVRWPMKIRSVEARG